MRNNLINNLYVDYRLKYFGYVVLNKIGFISPVELFKCG